jgi:hypothetical protein
MKRFTVPFLVAAGVRVLSGLTCFGMLVLGARGARLCAIAWSVAHALAALLSRVARSRRAGFFGFFRGLAHFNKSSGVDMWLMSSYLM